MKTTHGPYSVYSLAKSGTSDVVLSADGDRLYVGSEGGSVRVFDLATHALVDTWDAGRTIGGMSLSPDGSFLLAAEETTQGKSVLYKIDTATGAKTTLTRAGDPYYDVQAIDGHTAMVVINNVANLLDLDSGKTTYLGDILDHGAGTQLIMTQDGDYTLIQETGDSGGPMWLFDSRLEQVVKYTPGDRHGSTGDGHLAISTAADQAAEIVGRRVLDIYDLNLDPVRSLDLGESAGGFAYDHSGHYAFVFLAESGVVAEYETDSWSKVDQFSVGHGVFTDVAFGDTVLVDDTDSHITVIGAGGAGSLQIIDLTARNETFAGTAGADTMAGGDGFDTYLVNNVGDVVTEAAHAGDDTVRASVNYTLTDNVESLVLLGKVVSGTGNKADNLITGNGADNLLDGAAGDDRLDGGYGSDHLYGRAGADTLDGGAGGSDTLDGGEGFDVASYASALQGVNLTLAGSAAQNTRGAGTDTLINMEGLVGSAYGDLLHGSRAADHLEGGAGADTLVGGAGADTLIGGDGADVFRFTKLIDSPNGDSDLIVDLTAEDRIDLSLIDADTTTPGNQAFVLADPAHNQQGNATLTYNYYNAFTTTLDLDVNHDRVPDMTIVLQGQQAGFTNFVL